MIVLYRYAAVLVLKELAINAPTLFNVHVASFVECVWVALSDPQVLYRKIHYIIGSHLIVHSSTSRNSIVAH